MTHTPSDNNPLREPYRHFKNNLAPPREEREPHALAPECHHCGVPMRRGSVAVEAQGRVQSQVAGDHFCSDRCLRRNLQRLSNDDAEALRVLQDRHDRARQEIRTYREYVGEAEAHMQALREAFVDLLRESGLESGRVPPAGGVIRQKVQVVRGLANNPPRLAAGKQGEL